MAIVELITAVAVGAIVMEAPHWHIPTQTLFFVDLFNATIHSYIPSLDQSYTAVVSGYEGKKIGFITPVENRENQFVVGIMNKLELISWDGRAPTARWLETLGEFDITFNGTTRFNDGKADRMGRVYAGTMLDEDFGTAEQNPVGSLYRYAPSTRDTGLLKSSIKLSNGLTWNDVRNKFYYIDSLAYNILEYDYDPVFGSILNEKLFVDLRTSIGGPPSFTADGMTIDSDGNLWVALFNGGSVIKINGTTGDIIDEIEIPNVPQVTSLAFGGTNLDELYVTTAAINDLPPPSGGLFRIKFFGARGLPMYNVKVTA